MFEIIVDSLYEFLVSSESHRQTCHILLFCQIVLFFGAIVSNHIVNFVYTRTTVVFICLKLLLYHRQTFVWFGEGSRSANNYF